MRVVGSGSPEQDEAGVHTIDVWYSERRKAWVVERLGAGGEHLGVAHVCPSEVDASDCVEHWLRAHPETVAVAPTDLKEVRTSIKREIARRAARAA